MLVNMGLITSKSDQLKKISETKNPRVVEYRKRELEKTERLIKALTRNLDKSSMDYLIRVFKSRVGLQFKNAYIKSKIESATQKKVK